MEIGAVFEVTGGSIKIALSRDIKELTRSHSGRVYDVGQIGSILKIHLGRRLIFATVRLLRLQSDEETAALSASAGHPVGGQDRRVIEADLLGEGWYNSAEDKLAFTRGVSTYPLPLQAVHLITKNETEQLFESAEDAREDGIQKTCPYRDVCRRYAGALSRGYRQALRSALRCTRIDGIRKIKCRCSHYSFCF